MDFTENDLPASCLPALASKGLVLTTLTNSGYLLYTLNLLKSLQPYGLDTSVFVVCLDTKGAEQLRKRGYRVYDVQRQSLGRFSAWNTKGYDAICYYKLVLLHRLLSLGYTTVFVDGDVVFRKNPVEEWVRWMACQDHDVWIQNDAQRDKDTTNLCTGYLMAKPHPAVVEAYDCLSEQGKVRYRGCAGDNNDQTYFNVYVKPVCRVFVLPLEFYPNGKMYMEHAEQMDKTAVLVHFNWIHGHHKMVEMKRRGMWLLSPEDE